MKILLCSVPFRPSVGGIETISALLAERFHAAGHRVVLVTRTDSATAETDAFEVVRRPSVRRLFALLRWADVVFHNNISLRFAWPMLFCHRPWVVAHHTWIAKAGLAARVKRLVLRLGRHIAVSQAVARSLPVPCVVVPNPYADDLFVRHEGAPRRGQLVFVGRLVSDKGVDVLLEALALLAKAGTRIRLTVIGDGPEKPALRQQAEGLGIAHQVEFVGRRTGPSLAAALNAHQILVVPSVWEEPFGVVALEAMACGCVPLVARSGGLPEAVGYGGAVFERADPQSLAQGIVELLFNPESIARYRARATAHLERHSRDAVAQRYLQVITDAAYAPATQRTARAG